MRRILRHGLGDGRSGKMERRWGLLESLYPTLSRYWAEMRYLDEVDRYFDGRCSSWKWIDRC